MCVWKGSSVCAWGEGGCVHKEGFECACMGIGCVYGRGRVCVHGERVCIRMGWSGRMCTYEMCPVCMREEREGVCIWKSLSVYAWGEEGCVHMEGFEWSNGVHGEREMCFGRGRVACMGRGCVHMEGVKWRAWGEGRVFGRGGVCSWGEGGCVYGRGGVCVHGGGCVYGRGGVCMDEERKDACIWKGYIHPLPMHAHSNPSIYTPSPHAHTLHPFHTHTPSLSQCMHTQTLPYAHILSSSMYTPSLHAWGEDVCIWKWSDGVHGERVCAFGMG